MEEDYIQINKALWDARTDIHKEGEFYDLDTFIKDPTLNVLNKIELDQLGNLTGKRVLHLQCHFGMDTISLSRLGAEVVGIDFSPKAIELARKLASQLKSNAQFFETDVFNTVSTLKKNNIPLDFDIVFTSYGVIGWLPNLNEWGKIINSTLKPQGIFVMAEFHPFIWMYEPNAGDWSPRYSYFNEAAIIEETSGTYSDRNADIKMKEITWNHSLSDVFTALFDSRLLIYNFKEFDYSNYNCFSNMISCKIKDEHKEVFRFRNISGIPITYCISAAKLI